MATRHCLECGQVDIGQYGECPCPKCGLPTTWDDPSSQAVTVLNGTLAPETGESEWHWAMRSAETRLHGAADGAEERREDGLAAFYRETAERLRRARGAIDRTIGHIDPARDAP